MINNEFIERKIFQILIGTMEMLNTQKQYAQTQPHVDASNTVLNHENVEYGFVNSRMAF